MVNKRIIFLTFLCCVVSLLAEVKVSKLNPDFLHYINSSETVSSSGAVPPPVLAPYRNLQSLAKTAELPAAYDLRESNFVTSVKNQGGCGSCWTFSTYGAVESNWLMQDFGEWDLSENNLKNASGTALGACGGGNAYLSSAYFARGDGPITENDDPYQEYDDTYYDLPISHWINEAQFLPSSIYYTEDELPYYIDLIKNSILENGGHSILYYHNSNYYTTIDSNYTYYYPNEGTVNHAVTIIGWDDSVATLAPEKGAWIIKNSWGTSWEWMVTFTFPITIKSLIWKSPSGHSVWILQKQISSMTMIPMVDMSIWEIQKILLFQR